MTPHDETTFDPRIADWLEDDPNDAPDQALEIVLAAFPSIKQRHASRLPRRFTMTTLPKLAFGGGGDRRRRPGRRIPRETAFIGVGGGGPTPSPSADPRRRTARRRRPSTLGGAQDPIGTTFVDDLHLGSNGFGSAGPAGWMRDHRSPSASGMPDRSRRADRLAHRWVAWPADIDELASRHGRCAPDRRDRADALEASRAGQRRANRVPDRPTRSPTRRHGWLKHGDSCFSGANAGLHPGRDRSCRRRLRPARLERRAVRRCSDCRRLHRRRAPRSTRSPDGSHRRFR